MTEAARPSHPRLVEIVEFLAASRVELVAAAESVPGARWSAAHADGAWSAAQVLDHLRIVEHGVVRLMQKFAREARAAGHPAEEATTSVIDDALVARTRDRGRRLEAPPRVVPTGAPGREEALSALARERTDLLAAVGDLDGLALGTLTWVHPVLGTLNLYEWLVFVGAHELRHAGQLREIATSAAPR